MEIHILFAKIAWISFIIVMTIRPLASIYPQKFLLLLMEKRRLLGLVCGYAALLHVFIFLYTKGLITIYFFNTKFWNMNNLFGWGNLALIFTILPLITSNNISQKILGKKWKTIQRLSYVAFVFTGIHVSFAHNSLLQGILPVTIWFVLLFWADKKTHKQANK